MLLRVVRTTKPSHVSRLISQPRAFAHTFGSHCSYCGEAFPVDSSAAEVRTCSNCNQTTYSNPLPVVVGIVHKKEEDRVSVLCVRRGIEPCRGEIALVGGFLESGETWQAGLSREIQEEVGIPISTESWELHDVQTVLKPPRLIVTASATCPEQYELSNNLNFDKTEVQEVLWIQHPMELCFATHTSALHSFFSTHSKE